MVQVCQWIGERERERERERRGREREGLINPAGKYRRTTFIFSVLISQLGTACVRSFVRLFLPLLQIEARSEMRAFGLDGKSQEHLNF